MRRSQSRAASPTPTAFSGISNYKTESYRPIGKDKSAPAVPQIDYRTVSKIHFDELSSYLAAYLARSTQDSRSTARQKLTRLTIQQFHELSTDVYDELVRRKSDKQVPFLPVREEFHPKRNQARQKLATLPTSRFEDLSSDVYYELARRYPEFKEDPSGKSNQDSEDRPSDSGYGSGSRRPSEDRRRPSEATYSISSRQSEDVYRGRKPGEEQGPPLSRSAMSHNYSGSVASSRRRPSQDTTGRRSEDRGGADIARRPSGMTSTSGASESASSTMQSATATSQMIIPTKSTIEEEYIEVPYAREARESGSTTIDDREPSRERGDLLDEPDSASDYRGSTSPAVGGLSGLSARLRDTDDDDDLGRRSGDDFYNKGRASAASDRSGGGRFGGRASVADDTEKMKRDYEYKIATMQSQMSSMQRDLDSAGARERRRGDDDEKVRQLEDQLEQMRRQSEAQANRMRELEDEVDSLRRERDRRERDKVADEEELQILRDRCERLEEERERGGGGGGADPEIVDQLRSDMEGLMAELEDLQRRNDELMTAKDSDLGVIRELDSQLKEYKRKYEQAKTELRSVKATSQLYSQAPRVDRSAEELPVTADGGILDIHLTAFLSSVDSLLTAGRSNAPTRVLSPMKAVVNAASAIIEDSRAFERRSSRERSDVDPETLKALSERLEATLSNLVAAVKTHASSSGMSPVSLLDAAASHVSATVTELARTVLIRRATKQEQEQFAAASPPTRNAFSPMLRSVEERSMHSRVGSTASSGAGGRMRGFGRGTPSGNSSSEHTSSPPPIFDQPNGGGNIASDESATGAEDPWAELKPYLEAQTESIVYAIQSVLSGVRSPTPSPTLNENITQIITIVSSIVAVCNDNLPPASAAQGKEILRELGEHANKLSEVQALPEVTKESRQIMAKSSFAVANAMKGLMKL